MLNANELLAFNHDEFTLNSIHVGHIFDFLNSFKETNYLKTRGLASGSFKVPTMIKALVKFSVSTRRVGVLKFLVASGEPVVELKILTPHTYRKNCGELTDKFYCHLIAVEIICYCTPRLIRCLTVFLPQANLNVWSVPVVFSLKCIPCGLKQSTVLNKLFFYFCEDWKQNMFISKIG